MIELNKLTKIYKTDAETVNALNSIQFKALLKQFSQNQGFING